MPHFPSPPSPLSPPYSPHFFALTKLQHTEILQSSFRYLEYNVPPVGTIDSDY